MRTAAMPQPERAQTSDRWRITGKMRKGFAAGGTDRHRASGPTGDGAADGKPQTANRIRIRTVKSADFVAGGCLTAPYALREPCAGKLARTVPGGWGCGNTPLLPYTEKAPPLNSDDQTLLPP